MKLSNSDFGLYLATVEERDVDLILMEEFHATPEFVIWFSKQAKVAGAVDFAGAWHSVCDADGETDLLLRVRTNGGLVGILIENKIAAPEQEKQDERYHLRGVRAQIAGKFAHFKTCICAPQTYLDALPSNSLYDQKIAYEAVANWFSQRAGPRFLWRASIIDQAISQARRGYKMIVNETVTRFHRTYWEYLQKHHPQIMMRRPTPKGSKSNWIILKASNFPKGVKLHHKLDQEVLELGFERRTVSELLAAKGDWPEDMKPVQKEGTAAISIAVPFVDVARDIAIQKPALEVVFAAAYRLLPLATLLK